MASIHQAFKDVQALAERVQESDNFEVDLKIFLDFSEEMQQWVRYNFEDRYIWRLLDRMPVIEKDKVGGGFWKSIGATGISMYRKSQQRQQVKEQVRETAGLFAAIHQFILKHYDDER